MSCSLVSLRGYLPNVYRSMLHAGFQPVRRPDRLVGCLPANASHRLQRQSAQPIILHRQSSRFKRIAQKWENLFSLMQDLHGKR